MSIDPTPFEAKLREIFPDVKDEVDVAPDRYEGLRIRVVSPSFKGVSKSSRRDRVLAKVDDELIASLTLLAPEEVGSADDPTESEFVPDFPDWANLLAEVGVRQEIEVHLPSRFQEQLARPLIATFFSLRGGVGRSTAVTHTAFSLAELGFSVLCIDMDLEAPGLASLLGVEDEISRDCGVVNLLTTTEISGSVPKDLTEHFIRIPTSNANERLELLPAGRVSASYARDLALLDPDAWYREDLNPLRLLLDAIRSLDESLRPDVVLVDSRTGLSPIAAPLLFDVADIAIINFFPHPQAKLGTGLLTRALLTAKTARAQREGRQITPEPRFVVSPVPPSEENRVRAQQRAMDWIAEWLAPARDVDGEKPFDNIEDLVQVIGYNEEVASSDGVKSASGHGPYRPIAEWIAGLVETGDSTATAVGRAGTLPGKSALLNSLDFGGQTADTQSVEALRDIFVSTASVEHALAPSARLVIGRKGTGKTLLFRQMLFDSHHRSIAVTSPPGEHRAPLVLDGGQYESVSRELARQGLTWQAGWRAIIGLALMREGIVPSPVGVDDLRVASDASYRGASLVADLRELLRQTDADVLLSDWIAEIDESLEESVYLLFDGLDTGFGVNRKLRADAVTGLLLLVNGQARGLKSLQFKVFLREDIFRAVELPNKSHLRAEAAVLAWSDQYDYLRIVIRQAWRSDGFRQFVQAVLGKQESLVGVRGPFNFSETPIEYWPNDIVLAVWRILVGERMSGGKTAFTHNWVWSRLADANEDHAPRHLVTLFEQATTSERSLEPGSPYSRALIRPRALADALDRVSVDAVEAVEEEFPELGELFGELRSVGRTPFESNQLNLRGGFVTGVELAAEVGLLGRGADGRYRVPELYRRALNMARQGQQ